MRCPRCGNENSAENRFCGMCGTTLLAPAPPAAKPEPVAAPAAPPTPIRAETAPARPTEAPRTAQHAPASRADVQDSPSISGPSFLGLNDPPLRSSVQRSRGSLSIDPNQAPSSRNLDYLLEDEEESTSSGAWKYILILVALALAVGLGYLRWKNQGLAWLNLMAKKPAVTTQAPDSTDGAATPAAASSTPSITPDSQPPASTPPPAGATTQPPASGTAAPSGAASTPATSAPAPGNAPASAPAATDTPNTNDSGNPPASTDKAASARAKDSSADKSASSDSGDDADDASSQPASKPAAKEPSPKPRPAVPVVDPVTEAQKYLYGRGAPQDCDRGLRLLKPAANQANPKAMIEMGALYSAGLCTPHDLPTAYRWFARALRKQPDNTSVQADLQKLWSEMTQPERQLAIKLSQ